MRFLKNDKIRLLIIFTMLVLVIRILSFSYPSTDYEDYLKVWIDYMRDNGGIFSLKEHFTNYNLPYLTILAIISYIPIEPLYLIKFVSIIFDFLIAIMGYKFVIEWNSDEKNRGKYAMYTYIALLFAPTILMNSATWGQCDSIYSFFSLLAIYYLIKEKYNKSFIFLGVAFAFKLQFIFILPLFVIMFFCNKKISLKYFLYIPIVNFILCIPGILVGSSPFYTYEVYLEQTSYYSNSLNVVNIYNYVPENTIIGVCFTLFLFLILLIWCYKKKINWNTEKILSLGLLSIVLCYFFLPRMHERYLYMADVLSIIWFAIHKKYKYIPIAINLCSLATYLRYLAGLRYPKFVHLLLFILLFIAIIKLFMIFNNQSKEKVNT